MANAFTVSPTAQHNDDFADDEGDDADDDDDVGKDQVRPSSYYYVA